MLEIKGNIASQDSDNKGTGGCNTNCACARLVPCVLQDTVVQPGVLLCLRPILTSKLLG